MRRCVLLKDAFTLETKQSTFEVAQVDEDRQTEPKKN